MTDQPAGVQQRLALGERLLPLVGIVGIEREPAEQHRAPVGHADLAADREGLSDRLDGCRPPPGGGVHHAQQGQPLGLEPAGSAIVSIGGLGDGIEQRLAAAGIKAAARAGGCRLSFHIYNDDDDVEVAVAALERVAR